MYCFLLFCLHQNTLVPDSLLSFVHLFSNHLTTAHETTGESDALLWGFRRVEMNGNKRIW